MAFAKQSRALEVRMAAKLLAHVSIQPQMMKEGVALEDAVMLQQPPVLIGHEGLQHGRGKLGVIGCSENIAHCMQQSAGRVFFIQSIAVRRPRGWSRVPK